MAKLSAVQKSIATITLTVVFGDVTIHPVYKPGAYKSKYKRQMVEFAAFYEQHKDDLSNVPGLQEQYTQLVRTQEDILLNCIESLDLEDDDGNAIPVTPEGLGSVSDEVLGAILMAIQTAGKSAGPSSEASS